MYSTNFISQGWECPKCKRVYSPTTSMCAHCPQKLVTTTSTGFGTTSTNTALLHLFEREENSDKCKKCGKTYANHHVITNL